MTRRKSGSPCATWAIAGSLVSDRVSVQPVAEGGEEARIESGRLRQARKQAGREHERRVCRRQNRPGEIVARLDCLEPLDTELGRDVPVVGAEHPEDGNGQLLQGRERVEAGPAELADLREHRRARPTRRRLGLAGEPAQASVSPTVVVGPELATSQWTAGSPTAASGSIQPAWLSPNRPTRVRSICGSAATNATSALASRARSWTVPAAAASPGYVPPD